MTFILRLPAILVLFVLVLISWAAALAAAIVLARLPLDLGAVLTETQIATVSASSWIEVGLWGGAGLFFLVSAIRLIRRTQGFWTWLVGFACFGGRWAMAQLSEGGLVATIQQVDPNAYLKPEMLVASPESAEAQVGVLGIVLIVGVLIFIIDAADRAHWDRHGA
jgi:hypothetical protein